MIVMCCSCKKLMGKKEGKGVSHGICNDCIKKLYPDLWKKRNASVNSKNETKGEMLWQ